MHHETSQESSKSCSFQWSTIQKHSQLFFVGFLSILNVATGRPQADFFWGMDTEPISLIAIHAQAQKSRLKKKKKDIRYCQTINTKANKSVKRKKDQIKEKVYKEVQTQISNSSIPYHKRQ